MNATRFQVIESGLIVPGMPFSRTIREFARESAAIKFAAKLQAEGNSRRSISCKELRDAYRVFVVGV